MITAFLRFIFNHNYVSLYEWFCLTFSVLKFLKDLVWKECWYIYIFFFYPQYDQTASLKIKVSKINYGSVTVYYSCPLWFWYQLTSTTVSNSSRIYKAPGHGVWINTAVYPSPYSSGLILDTRVETETW